MSDTLTIALASVPFGWARAADAGLTFRRIADADLPFLARVYASTRAEELAVTDWTDAQKAAFLDDAVPGCSTRTTSNTIPTPTGW